MICMLYLKNFIVMLGYVCKINLIKLWCLVYLSYNKNLVIFVIERERDGNFKFKIDNLNKLFINNDIFNLKY